MTLVHDADRGPSTTPTRRASALVVVGIVLCAVFAGACGSKESPGTVGEVGTYDPDASGSFAGGDGSTSGPLEASIEQDHVVVTFVTLSCAGECAAVQAVASGGHPPYTYAWDDGTTSASRQVCPTASTSYGVQVTDTGSTGEFARPAETVHVPLTADVLACPDGGVVTDASSDSSCSPVTLGSAPASCAAPTGGQIDSLATVPLVANRPTTFRVTGTGNYVGGQGWHFEIWGSPDGCALDEMLGAFQPVNGPYDIHVCVTPSRGNAYVVVFYRYEATDGLSLSPFSVARCDECVNTSDD